ncbi:unnamed protein product [Cylindrotheca closterium]|uniref:Uncharacterized protein n=1 Tax=Cylindrotheca closterium TaxID=2856 RepID=A0AAD2G2I7_9STRA|nr:unnamed protein product [Cylindrotheca closterium]
MQSMMESPDINPGFSSDKSVVTVSSSFSSVITVGRDEKELRSRLLNKLGIHDSSGFSAQPMTAAQNRRVRILRGMGVGYTTFKSPPDGSATRSQVEGVVRSKEPLKSDTKSDSSTNGLGDKKTKIAFQDEVEILPIPTRHEYSDRIKSRIWSNRYELQENAERNAVEFAAEGWNWRNVTEDEGMYICSASGELVHPAWVGDIPRAEEAPRLDRGGPVVS